jgi:hypothetical protein
VNQKSVLFEMNFKRSWEKLENRTVFCRLATRCATPAAYGTPDNSHFIFIAVPVWEFELCGGVACRQSGATAARAKKTSRPDNSERNPMIKTCSLLLCALALLLTVGAEKVSGWLLPISVFHRQF